MRSVIFPLLCLAIDIVTGLQQQPLTTESMKSKGKLELLERLREAEIIPDILDDFVPRVQIAASWKKSAASLGNIIDPKYLQHKPSIDLLYWTDDDNDGGKEEADNNSIEHLSSRKYKHSQITLALTDPDAPSHKDPKWSQVCHWLVTHVPLDDTFKTSKKHFMDIVEYKAPAPPARTGLHRYVFVALTPLNGTTAKLRLSKPDDRRHWGYDGFRTGIREWAAEHGLGVIGANFIYAQHKEQ